MNEKEVLDLQEELGYYKCKCASHEEGLFKLAMDYAKVKHHLSNLQSKYDKNYVKLEKENEQLKHRLSKFQSKYDKSKTDELKVLVETENTVLLNKNEFENYVRRHNELKRRNKRRKEKNRKYRNELKKRLNEINDLKDFVQEDLCSEDKVLKGFIEEYL